MRASAGGGVVVSAGGTAVVSAGGDVVGERLGVTSERWVRGRRE
jgi:hypothetical protein